MKKDMGFYIPTAELKFVKGKLYQRWVSYKKHQKDKWLKVRGQDGRLD